MTCINCKFWHRLNRSVDGKGNSPRPETLSDDDKAGECRHSPPISAVSIGGGFRAYPVTRAVDWCGEFEAAEVKAAPLKPDELPIKRKKGKLD